MEPLQGSIVVVPVIARGPAPGPQNPDSLVVPNRRGRHLCCLSEPADGVIFLHAQHYTTLHLGLMFHDWTEKLDRAEARLRGLRDLLLPYHSVLQRVTMISAVCSLPDHDQ